MGFITTESLTAGVAAEVWPKADTNNYSKIHIHNLGSATVEVWFGTPADYAVGKTFPIEPGEGADFHDVKLSAKCAVNCDINISNGIEPQKSVGGSSSTPISVQGANYAEPSSLVGPFGAPFAANVDAATAQAAGVSVSPPATGKAWQRLQAFIRWASAPGAPVAGTPDATAVFYWKDGTNWYVLGRWPLKYITSTDSLDDKRNFSDYTEMPFPARCTDLAVGVEGYVGGTFYVDLQGVA